MSKDDKKSKDTCENISKKKENAPIESHDTAAWAGIEKQKSESKVPIPSIENVENAKDWVDEVKK